MRRNRANGLLGYADDARLLIVNADDFGMSESVNKAVLRSIKQGVARSTSLMVPWPGAAQARQILRENPEIDFGVHLGVICDMPGYRWGSVAPDETVPSLVDESGRFYGLDRRAQFVERAKLDELEVEFRAQIEAVVSAGLRPTHLDWHCLADGGRRDVFQVTLGLALRVALGPGRHTAHQPRGKAGAGRGSELLARRCAATGARADGRRGDRPGWRRATPADCGPDHLPKRLSRAGVGPGHQPRWSLSRKLEELVDAGPRAARRRCLHQSSRGATSGFQLHRELVQPVAPALLDRDAVAGKVRTCQACEERWGGGGLSYDPIAATRLRKRVKVTICKLAATSKIYTRASDRERSQGSLPGGQNE